MNRATKSGLAAETQAKMMSKYNVEHAQECLRWIKEITGLEINEDGDPDNFHETLKDGTVLCQVINNLKPGTIKKVQGSKMAFKCMENINSFVDGAKQCGVPNEETFQTVDLWEKQNLHSVVICIHSLGRKAGQFGKATIGPKESEKNVRNFSDEQLRASEGIVNLQYGSNKGASQVGMSFGNTRHM